MIVRQRQIVAEHVRNNQCAYMARWLLQTLEDLQVHHVRYLEEIQRGRSQDLQ